MGLYIKPYLESHNLIIAYCASDFSRILVLYRHTIGNLKMQEQAERQANRGTRKPMKECIKPGNVIDDDVKECMEGLRERDW